MTETMEQYMSKTQGDYGSGVTRPIINQDTHFELKGQFLKELCDNTFKVTQDQIVLRAFPVYLTGAASRWLMNQPSGSITTWEVGCELCKGPHYTKDCPQKEEGKTLEEAYYTHFGEPYQPGGQYRVAGLGFYQQNNGNSSYPDRRPSLEESLTKFMAESAKRHEEISNIIKEIRASIDASIRNEGTSIKTLEIQIREMSKVLQERGFENLPSSTDTNPRDQVKLISTTKANFSDIRRIILDAYDHTLPQKEQDPGSFTLPCFIHNISFDKALIDLGASVSIMPFYTYTNLGLGILSHTRLTIELADQTIKQPRGIAKNVLVRIGKFIFPIDFIILDIPEYEDVPLIPGRPFLSTAHSKIDVFKRKITLRVGEEKLVFKSVKPATSIIKRVFVIKSLDLNTKLIREGDESFDPTYGNYIELNDLDTPLETKMDQDVDFETTFVKTDSYKMNFSCVIRYKYVIADLLPSLSINLMSKIFYYSIIKDKDEGKNHARTLIDIPIFIGSFSIILGFTIIDDDDITKDIMLGMKFCKKYASCQMIMKKFSLGDKHERIMKFVARVCLPRHSIRRIDVSGLGEISPYLGRAARHRTCSPDQLHTLFSCPTLTNLRPTLKNVKEYGIIWDVIFVKQVGLLAFYLAVMIFRLCCVATDSGRMAECKNCSPQQPPRSQKGACENDSEGDVKDRQSVKRSKQSNVQNNCFGWRRGPEFTWEREDQMQKKYPHLFPISASVAGATS
ncbi:ribonuclease H-like domain-containing protein [Tanacetum coccineum]